MNFLAHLYLSGDSEGLLIGNFIADAVKGKAHEKFPIAIQKGIILHRRIDGYTDSHPIVLQSCKRLWEKHRHYSPVIIDIFYDHFLAAKWSNYSSIPLNLYTQRTYILMGNNQEVLPPKIQHMLTYMTQQDWLLNYSHIEGIRKTLTGMSRRTPFESGMETAVESLITNYELFEAEFVPFFEELKKYVAEEIVKLENYNP